MIPKQMLDAINEQINAELYSAYMYLSMASYFEEKNFQGFAHWMEVQAHEEVEHAMKFYKYVNDRGERVILKPIEGPPTEWESPLAAFQAAYQHEQKVTSLINNLVKISRELDDYATEAMLDWFVTEQVEEEANASEIVEKLSMIRDNSNGMLMMDRTLGQRGEH
ncbi:MAG: ferritin [Desulfuromonas sp. SDB]|nr:MAG: ferritin [Desulfuromonas sp. SDB]